MEAGQSSDFNLPIIPPQSRDTAAMIHRLVLREFDKRSKDVQIRTEKKPLTLHEQQLFIVESLPYIGPVSAKKLLEEFKTISRVFNASKDELKQVDGIGDKIAENIREVIESKYIIDEPYLSENQESLLSEKNKPEKELRLKKEKRKGLEHK